MVAVAAADCRPDDPAAAVVDDRKALDGKPAAFVWTNRNPNRRGEGGWYASSEKSGTNLRVVLESITRMLITQRSGTTGTSIVNFAGKGIT